MILWGLIKRNCKIYFKDKSVFFPSLITPLILLLLYITFLRNVYVTSFESALPTSFNLDHSLIDGFVGGWLISSMLAVCCITVSFSANTIMVSDKSFGNYKDLCVAPIKKSTLNLSYYLATVIVTGIICAVALIGGFIYLSIIGWYLSFLDVLGVIFSSIILILFGTGLSSIIFKSMKSLGGVSAICTIVSAGYGFICGAYMPISQFGSGLQNILMCMPWTYGTGMIRTHLMSGVLNELESSGVPSEVVDGITTSFDTKLVFFDKEVSLLAMYMIMIITVVILVAIFVLSNFYKTKVSKKKK